MLRYLATKINQQIESGNKVTRKFLSNAIWDYEKKGREEVEERECESTRVREHESARVCARVGE